MKKTEPETAPVKQDTPAPTPPAREVENAERPKTGGAFVRQADGTLVPEVPEEKA